MLKEFCRLEILNCIFLDETRSYVEQIHGSPLHVEFDAVCFGNFLNSEEHKLLQLRVVNGDAWSALIKVHQVLENTLYDRSPQ